MSTRVIAIPLQPTQTGLTLSAQLADTTNTAVGGAITTGFNELGGGFYEWYYASFPAAFRGVVKFSSSGTIVAVNAINPEEAEYVDTAVSGVAASVWGISSRTLSAFGFSVTLSSSGLDQVVLQSGINARQGLEILFITSAGVITGDGSNTITVSPPTTIAATGTPRIVATMGSVDRTATVVTPPA